MNIDIAKECHKIHYPVKWNGHVYEIDKFVSYWRDGAWRVSVVLLGNNCSYQVKLSEIEELNA